MSEKRVVKVEFLDHSQVQDIKLDEVKKAQPIRCHAYGELLVEAPSYIIVLCTYQEEVEDSEPQNCAMLILKGAIVNITDLTPKEGENT